MMTKTLKDGTTKQINISNGSHEGSSASMESAMARDMLDHFRSKFAEMGANQLKITLCIDGDVGLNKMLEEDPLVDDVFRDLAHVLKNIPKNLAKQLGQSDLATIHSQRAKSWLASVLFQAWSEDLTNEEARDIFLNYVKHHSNIHDKCLPGSPCRQAGWVQDPKTKLQDKAVVASQITSVLQICWAEGAKLVTDLRTSNCENANSQATVYHDKRKDLPASWKVRDGVAAATSQVMCLKLYWLTKYWVGERGRE
jgi:hypothetical protein